MILEYNGVNLKKIIVCLKHNFYNKNKINCKMEMIKYDIRRCFIE
jgi:hypothetical protein